MRYENFYSITIVIGKILKFIHWQKFYLCIYLYIDFLISAGKCNGDMSMLHMYLP